MTPLRLIFVALPVAALLAAGFLGNAPAAEEEDPAAAKAMAQAVRRGQILWRKTWRPGIKSCIACHATGPNRMTKVRLKSYPKYDTELGRVVTVQQKLNQMIVTKSGGTALSLGGEDLNGLEAYLATLR